MCKCPPGGRSVRSGARGLRGKKRTNPAAFRKDLREGVTFTGEMPYQHRGGVTDTLYVWNTRHPTRWVDRRDLPGLIKDAGVDDLDGDWIATFKEQKKKRIEEEEPESESEPPVEAEEVKDDV